MDYRPGSPANSAVAAASPIRIAPPSVGKHRRRQSV